MTHESRPSPVTPIPSLSCIGSRPADEVSMLSALDVAMDNEDGRIEESSHYVDYTLRFDLNQ